MPLSREQKHELIEQGFTVLRNAVPRALVDDALRAINQDIGRGIDPAKLATYQVQTYCPDLVRSERIVGLMTRSPALGLIAPLFGEGRLETPEQAQIALRFPGFGNPKKPPGPHVDGIPDLNRSNGVPEGTILSFSALACVLLSDLPEADAGNFRVWPGTHRSHAAWLREHGVRRLLERMPDVPRAEPVQITGKAGDVVLAHYLLGHSVAPNASPNIRYACFFRLTVAGLPEHREESIVDPWRDWQGLREELAAEPSR
jgi:hypothetical protein